MSSMTKQAGYQSFIIEEIKAFFVNHTDKPIIIAYSGGIDSQVLLHVLHYLQQHQQLLNPLYVCHVNHGISSNALKWQEFAQQQCQLLGLEFTACQVKVKAKARHSLEALAREARYQALQEVSQRVAEQCQLDKALIVTGHNSDDQSETFLLALKRGAGLKGLSAMGKETAFGKHLLVRPMLNISRLHIEHYAQAHQLTWIEDESNLDIQFDRNFLRQQIIPLLTARWPSILQTINRSATHCQNDQLLLNELAQQDLTQCHLSPKVLSTVQLKQLSLARFNNVLRYFLALNQCLMPSVEQLKQVYEQQNAKEDKSPAIKVGDYCLRRYQDELHLTINFQDISTWQQQIDMSLLTKNHPINIELPDELGRIVISEFTESDALNTDNQRLNTQTIRVPLASQKVSLSFAHNNPRCTPDFRQQSRPLKKVLQELAIPPWQLKRIAFLFYDDCLVADLG